MTSALRKRVDMSTGKFVHGAFAPHQEYKLWNAAVAKAIPKYRAKVVRIPNGQVEVSFTPVNESNVINARMGFNPLLDCPRRELTPEERQRKDVQNHKRSAKRARQNVRYLAKSMCASHMLTFTYRKAVFVRDEVAKHWKEFLRLFRKRYPEWQYLAAIEKHNSDESMEAHKGGYHLHVAVKGRQDIKWLLRCWLIAIGQPLEDVNDWFSRGVKLEWRSMGAVNVQAPQNRWDGEARNWNRRKIAAYLTKYIGKDFDEDTKARKKYWHSEGIEKATITRFWLKADSWEAAYYEIFDLVFYSGSTSISVWGDTDCNCAWITGEIPLDRLHQFSAVKPEEIDWLEDDHLTGEAVNYPVVDRACFIDSMLIDFDSSNQFCRVKL